MMWMPSNRPLGRVCAEGVTLDWETIGRAIRECVLDAIEMQAAQHAAMKDEIESSSPPRRETPLD